MIELPMWLAEVALLNRISPVVTRIRPEWIFGRIVAYLAVLILSLVLIPSWLAAGMHGRWILFRVVLLSVAIFTPEAIAEFLAEVRDRKREEEIREAEIRLLKVGSLLQSLEFQVRGELSPSQMEEILASLAAIMVPISRINVNEASQDELTRLPGIGSRLAAAIVEDRKKRGPFLKEEDLLRVRGLGRERLGRLRSSIRFDDPEGEGIPGTGTTTPSGRSTSPNF